MKKKLLALVGIILVLLLGFIGWSFFTREEGVTPGEALRETLPFGSGEEAGEPTTNDRQLTTGENSELFNEQGSPVANLFPLSDAPVAGAVAFSRGSQTIVRYVDRATGHIFEVTLPAAAEPIVREKVANNTLPQVYEAHFQPNGNAALLRMLENDSNTQKNIIITVSTTSTAVNLRGEIGAVAVGSGNTLFYSLKDSKTIVSSNWNGSSLRTILSSAFTDWRLAPSGSNLIITTKASVGVPGYAYTLNATNGALAKILGPLNALSVVSEPSSTWLFYSYNNGGARSAARNLRTGATSESLLITLAEKCAWGNSGEGMLFCGVPIEPLKNSEPDSWYQGKTAFSDRIWKFDVNQESGQVLSEPKTTFGLNIDVVKPQLSPNGGYLIFTNKSDLSLWALRLSEV